MENITVGAAMNTLCLKLSCPPRQEIEQLLGKVKYMQQKAVNWLIANKKTALSSLHVALYRSLRQQFPDLHSQWVTSALRTATHIVHAFHKRKRKGKAKRPSLRQPFVSLSPYLFRVFWEGKCLKVSIFRVANDHNPIILCFSPHHKYKELLKRWADGECSLGQITMTSTSIRIPLKFACASSYQPTTVIGIDSNER